MAARTRTTARTTREQQNRQSEATRSALERAFEEQRTGDVSPAELVGLAYGSLPTGAELDDVLPVAREIAGSGVTR